MKAYPEALQRVALFRNMGGRELLSILGCLGAQLRQYPKGDVIFHAGDPATRLGAVFTSRVRINRTETNGQRVVMGEIRPGGLSVESFTCTRVESLPVTVTAAADVVVLLVDCGRIFASCSVICTFHVQFISNLLQVLAEKNLSLTGKLGHPSGRTVQERLLSYLEGQAARTDRAAVTVSFDRQALAGYLCVDRSTLFHIIGALQQENMFTIRRDHFTLNFQKEASLWAPIFLLWIRALPVPAPSFLTGGRTSSAWRKRSSPSSTPGRGEWSMTSWRSGPPSIG